MVIWHIAQVYQVIVSQLGNCGETLKAWYQIGQMSFKALSICHSLWRRANTENVSYVIFLQWLFDPRSSTCMTPNVWHFPQTCHHSFFFIQTFNVASVGDHNNCHWYCNHTEVHCTCTMKNDITYTKATYSSIHSGLTSLTTS